MSNQIQRSYFEDEIRSATPQRLRLMLIDGAIRFAHTAEQSWIDDPHAAHTALGRCRNIVIELIGSIRADRDSCEHIVQHIQRDATPSDADRKAETDSLEKIARDTMAVYLVVYRQLNEAQLNDAPQQIAAAIEVLQIERETTRLICEQLPAAPVLTKPHLPPEISSSHAAALLEQQSSETLTTPPVASPATYGSSGYTSASMSFDA